MCTVNGIESPPQSDVRDFFSFNEANTSVDRPATGLCYIKLLIRDCFLNNSVTLNSIDSNTGTIVFTDTILVPEVEPIFFEGTGGGDGIPTPRIPCNASNASPRGVCIEFNCSTTVQSFVRQNPDSPTPGLCDLTSIAPILSSPLISGSTSNPALIILTNILLINDYNNPDIGLYHDPTTPQMALERCNTGNGSTSSTIDILAGYAAEFSCFMR